MKTAPVAAAAAALTVAATAGGGHATQIVTPAAAAQAPAPASPGARVYVVRPGDTLAAISQRFYGHTAAWPWLWHVNRARVGADPGLLEAGRILQLPRRHPVSYRAWPPPPPPPPAPLRVAMAAHVPQQHQRATFTSSGGMFSEAALERIWMSEGGSAAAAPHAACIAEHESGGNPGAVSPTTDYGLWQEHDDPAALDPAVSASAAVRMSGDGTNWGAWTTAGDC